jgi:hypothetical protein
MVTYLRLSVSFSRCISLLGDIRTEFAINQCLASSSCTQRSECSSSPSSPSTANPAEDYADKWSLDPSLERSFWRWHTQVRADLKKLADSVGGETLGDLIARTFGVVLSEEQLQPFGGGPASRAPAIVRSPVLAIPTSTPRPWGDCHRF